MTWWAAFAAMELMSACCALLNGAYFYGRVRQVETPLSRRIAASVLAVVSMGTLLESALILSLLAVNNRDATAITAWPFVRSVVAIGTLCITALVMWSLSRRR